MKNRRFRPAGSMVDTTTETLLLVDWANLMYRAWFVSTEEPCVAYCKFLDMLRLAVKRAKQPGVPLKIIFCGESRSPLKRKEICPDYKGTRSKNKNEEFAIFRKNLEGIFSKLGYKLVRVDGAEADDVIASIVAKKCHRCFCARPCENCDWAQSYTTDVVIFSCDRDVQQLLAWVRVLVFSTPVIVTSKGDFE